MHMIFSKPHEKTFSPDQSGCSESSLVTYFTTALPKQSAQKHCFHFLWEDVGFGLQHLNIAKTGKTHKDAKSSSSYMAEKLAFATSNKGHSSGICHVLPSGTITKHKQNIRDMFNMNCGGAFQHQLNQSKIEPYSVPIAIDTNRHVFTFSFKPSHLEP